jgi:hypothetical protein
MRYSPLYPLALAIVITLSGCQTAYYETMEKFGVHKREILVDRIEEARDDQEATKEQFQSALEQFSAVTQFDGGNLEAHYKRLNKELERSEASAKEVSASIDGVEDVATALFAEWETELSQYSNGELRRQSSTQLSETKVRYQKLLRAMRNAEAKIEPVLVPFRDQVLFLKHNLNARAIASLQNELNGIQTDVSALIQEMERSIDEANTFIKSLDA